MVLFRVALLLLSTLLIISPLLYLYASKECFYSFIVAFSASSLILLASFKSYKTMVTKRLEVASSLEFDSRDVIDKLDDPYNLYDENENKKSQDLNLKELIKNEKRLLKKSKRSFSNFLKDSAKAFSFLRIGAYAIFVIGFFYLLKSKLLYLPCYLATIIIPNIIIVVYLQIVNSKEG